MEGGSAEHLPENMRSNDFEDQYRQAGLLRQLMYKGQADLAQKILRNFSNAFYPEAD
jgi:hypothetical protein